jgi:hypothetical protein
MSSNNLPTRSASGSLTLGEFREATAHLDDLTVITVNGEDITAVEPGVGRVELDTNPWGNSTVPQRTSRGSVLPWFKPGGEDVA